MIYIKDKTARNVILFPKNSIKIEEENNLSISLFSEATLKEYTFSNLNDADNLLDYYVIDEIDFSEIEDGEYVYEISSDKCCAKGLIRIGIIEMDKTEYDAHVQFTEYKY